MFTNNGDEKWKSLNEMGEFYAHSWKYSKAIKLFNEAIQLSPKQPNLYANRACAKMGLGNAKDLKLIAEAREDTKKAIELCRENIHILDQNALEHIKYARMLSMIACDNSSYAIRIRAAMTLTQNACPLMIENKNDEAICLIKQAIITMGQSHVQLLGDIKNTVKKCAPNNADAMFVKASLLWDHKDTKGCISFLKKCLSIHPRDANLHQILSFKYFKAMQINNAMDEINKAIELDSTNPLFFFSRATYFYKMATICVNNAEPLRLAFESFQKCLALNSDRTSGKCDEELDSLAYFNMANIELLRDNVEAVKLYWEKGVQFEIDWLKDCNFDTDYNPSAANCPREAVARFLKKQLYMCGNCEKCKPKFKCACADEAYCDQVCQKASWKAHKKVCKTKITNT